MRARISNRLTVALVVALLGCGPKPPVPVLTHPDGTVVETPPPPKEEDERAADALAKDTAGDKAKEDQILNSYAATLAAARIYRARAETAESAGKVEEAIAWYEKLLFYRPSFDAIDLARERYAGLLIKTARMSDAANMLRPLYKNALNIQDKHRLATPLIVALKATGQSLNALRVVVSEQVSSASSPSEKKTLTQDALAIIDGSLGFKDAVSLWNDVQNDTEWRELQPALAFKLAKIYYHVRDFKHSEEMLELVADRYGASQFAAPARDFMARLKARFQVESRTLGVILPLSGKYQQYGERSLAAIKQALQSDKSIRLVVKDTQGEAAITAQAVEDLVIKDHVIAIIGPLFSNEAQTAALKAEELSVPLIALSHKEGLPEVGPFVFRTALTVQAQAKELARVAFDTLGMTRFALLYPRNSYGLDFARTFWDEVDRKKGEIRAVETYEIDQTTFMEPVKKLVGRYYTNARTDYKDALLELRMKKLPSHRLQAELEKVEKRLPPIVDFDAVVIPDSSKNIGLIVPALAFEDIVMTHDPKELEKIRKATNNNKIKPISLLGASTWNSPQTLESCEQSCEGAIFVDAYYPDNPEPRVRDFVTGYHDATGLDPHLSEAQAFDTAGLLRAVLNSGHPTDRVIMRDQLTNAAVYEGVTGKIRFSNEGDAQKDLFVLTIQEGVIKRYTPEAEPPRG